MLVRYDYIDQFFKQKSFTNVDLDALRQTVEEKGYGTSERKAAMSLIDMHLAAYAVGSTLKEPSKQAHFPNTFKNQQKKKTKRNAKKKQISSMNISGLSSAGKSKQRKYNKRSEAKKLTQRLKNVTKNLNKLKYDKSGDRGLTKRTFPKVGLKREVVEDKKTIEIREMWQKRGAENIDSKNKRSQPYRGAKNTFVKNIYTRM
ncbi:MAG TPA: hypothetical protein DCE27_16035 [Xanthomarina gelatinilytica]|nr:hypothetical protein [Xanthomarina gelatinilytica]